MIKHKLLYRGKAKSLYQTDNAKELVCEFRDDTSAFDGEKKSVLSGKGSVNNQINTFVLEYLEKAGIKTHLIRKLNDTEALVRHLEMIPVECVVRNVAAGSLCRRLGFQQGVELKSPIFEFFLKNDQLHDPMLNEYHIRAFGFATDIEIATMQALSFEINQVLSKLFDEHGMILVDYKLEFGRYNNELVLGDEFTPDGCRLWDKNTREVLDKDRFRKDMGNVVEAYQEVARRFGLFQEAVTSV